MGLQGAGEATGTGPIGTGTGTGLPPPHTMGKQGTLWQVVAIQGTGLQPTGLQGTGAKEDSQHCTSSQGGQAVGMHSPTGKVMVIIWSRVNTLPQSSTMVQVRVMMVSPGHNRSSGS